jgi:hypothetical protein
VKHRRAWLKLVLWNRDLGLVIGMCAILCIVGFAALAQSATIPPQAKQHKALLIREARAQWGMDAPIATMAAQIHQESTWRDDAVSPAGAQGLAQFMPSTAKWLPSVAPDPANLCRFHHPGRYGPW